jgi:hypothetical protein
MRDTQIQSLLVILQRGLIHQLFDVDYLMRAIAILIFVVRAFITASRYQ